MSYLLGSLITPASRLAQPNWEGLSDMHRSDSSIELGNKLQGGGLLLHHLIVTLIDVTIILFQVT